MANEVVMVSQPTRALQGLPTWAKGVVAVGIVVGAGIGVYYLVKLIRSIEKRKGKNDTPKETVNAAKDDLAEAIKQGQSLSFNESAYRGAAESIFTLLDGCEGSVTTELNAIAEVIKVVKKPVDWLKLQAVFGEKDIDNCGIGTGDTRQSLKGLLTTDLDTFVFITPVPATILGGWKVPSGYYADSILILEKYMKEKGITF